MFLGQTQRREYVQGQRQRAAAKTTPCLSTSRWPQQSRWGSSKCTNRDAHAHMHTCTHLGQHDGQGAPGRVPNTHRRDMLPHSVHKVAHAVCSVGQPGGVLLTAGVRLDAGHGPVAGSEFTCRRAYRRRWGISAPLRPHMYMHLRQAEPNPRGIWGSSEDESRTQARHWGGTGAGQRRSTCPLRAPTPRGGVAPSADAPPGNVRAHTGEEHGT
jgi:hypothetical protein